MKIDSRQLIIKIVLALMLTSTNCKDSGTPSTPTTPAQTKPTINEFSASPDKITEGASSVLSWNVTNAQKVEIDQGLGQVALIGSTSVKPSKTTIYTLTATNGSQTEIKSCQITVEAPPPVMPTINSFDLNPATIVLEGSSTLSWNVSNAKKVEIDNGIGIVEMSRTFPILAVRTYPTPSVNRFPILHRNDSNLLS